MHEDLKSGGHNAGQPPPSTPGVDSDALRELSEMVLRNSSSDAIWVVREVERFSAAFPELSVAQTVIPRFTWEQLERQLTFLAGTPQRQALVAERVASIRKASIHKPEEMVLQEILIEAWVLLDEEPQGSAEEEAP